MEINERRPRSPKGINSPPLRTRLPHGSEDVDRNAQTPLSTQRDLNKEAVKKLKQELGID